MSCCRSSSLTSVTALFITKRDVSKHRLWFSLLSVFFYYFCLFVCLFAPLFLIFFFFFFFLFAPLFLTFFFFFWLQLAYLVIKIDGLHRRALTVVESKTMSRLARKTHTSPYLHARAGGVADVAEGAVAQNVSAVGPRRRLLAARVERANI